MKTAPRTISRRHALWQMLLLGLSPSIAGASEFVVFDGLLHQKKPGSRRLGLAPITAIANIWRKKSQQEVDEDGVISALRQLPAQTHTAFFDIECWPVLRVTDSIRMESLRKFMRVAEITRREKPELKFGFYGIPPAHTYWPLATSQFKDEYQEWRQANRTLKPLAEQVDFIFPSLYTYYEDRDGWKRYATAMLDAARHHEKPVMPFLWFEYHDSNSQLRDHELNAASWREELALCHQLADGVVLWGGYQRNWSDSARWWNAAKKEFQLNAL
ncbi:MAG: hypothetical protein ABUL58_00115 [Steroidobacter sp.]